MATQEESKLNNTASTNVTPAWQALLGVLPFMAYGLVSLTMHLGDSLPRPPIWLHPLLLFDGFVLIGLGAGVLAGFPRWAYSYGRLGVDSRLVAV